MFLELSRDKNTKDCAKFIKNLWKIIENHPYTSSSKFSSLELKSASKACPDFISS
jgi:hypothetical protein